MLFKIVLRAEAGVFGLKDGFRDFLKQQKDLFMHTPSE